MPAGSPFHAPLPPSRLGPAKRHIAHRREGGYQGEGIYYEEVVTLAGFGRAYSILYHLRPPTRVRRVEPAGWIETPLADEAALRHHHLRTGAMARGGDPVTGRVPLLLNGDVVLSRCRPARPQEGLFRNADADELIFVHRGAGVLRCLFGEVAFRDFDYLVIPRGTTYRLELDRVDEADLLVIQGRGTIGIPRRYVNPDGQLRLGAPFSERDLRGPVFVEPVDCEEETTVLIQDGSRLTRYVLASDPFDVVGWDGLVYPYAFNADDFEPITGTVHLPPPVHQTFESDGFVVCTFAPRMLDTHPEAIKVPYAHSNVHADEVLYYVRGNLVAGGGSRRRPSRFIRGGFPTGRTRGRSWAAVAWFGPRSWP